VKTHRIREGFMVTNTSKPGGQELTTSATAMGLPFLVGMFFGFRLFIMLLSVRLLGTDNQTGVEITLGLGFLLLLLVLFQSLGVVSHQTASRLRLPSVRWVAIFVTFSGCSLAWTAAASLPAAIAFWGAMTADVGMVALLLRVGPVKKVAISVIKGYVWGACAVAIIAWLLPAQSDLRLGDEELLGANQIGYLCAFAAFLAQYLVREKQGKWGAAAVLLAVTLLRCLSKTSIVAFLVAESFLLTRDRLMSRKTKVFLVLGSIATGIAFSSLLTSYFDIYTAGTSPETLTGRLGIWAVFLEEAVQQPWIGHGFHSAWNVIPPFGEFEARHAHNELLQQFYAYGVAGICMLVGLYGSFYRQIRTLPVSAFRTFLSAFLLFILVRGLTDTESFDLSLPMWAIVMFSLLMADAYATDTAAAGVTSPKYSGLPTVFVDRNPSSV
jgi:exopolysaccharide production protein ExoQ